MIVIPDASLVKLMRFMLGIDTPPTDVVYRFYTNDLTPGGSTALGDFTQASGGNISPHTVNVSDWSTSVTSGVAKAEKTQQTLTVTGSVSLYGFYVTNTGNSELYWCERFDGAPYNYPSVGGELKLTPRLSSEDVV